MLKLLTRILTLVLAVLMILAMSSCGSDNNKGGKKREIEGKLEKRYIEKYGKVPFTDLNGQTITISAWWNPKPQDKGTNELADLQWARKEYIEEAYNCKIEFKPLIESEMIAQITSSVARGKPVFDVGHIQSSWVYSLADQKMLQPLDEIEAFDFEEEKWVDFVYNIGYYKGKHYMMDPDIVRGPRVMLFWNKRMFKEKGLPDLYELQRKGEWTFDKLQEFAIALTEDTDGDGKPDVFGITGMQFMREQAIFSNGGNIVEVDQETGKPSFLLNSQNAIEALQWLVDLRYKYKCVDEPEASTWDYYPYSFGKNKSAMVVTEMYLMERNKEMKDDYGIVMFPKGPKGKDYCSYGGMFGVAVMPANNPKAQEAGFIYDLWTQPYEELGGLDSWKTRFELRIARDEECYESIKLGSDNSIFSKLYIYEDVRSTILNALHAIVNNQKTPAQGISEIEEQVQSVLDDIYEGVQ